MLHDEIWQYRLPMLRLAASILHHPQNAEDAVSAAMLHALQKCAGLRDLSALKPWLMQITARCAYDLLRREKRDKQNQPPIEYVLFPDVEGTLFAQLSRLPKKCAQVLTLYYYEGFDTREIARVLGISPTTVRMRMSRGRKQLKAILEEEEA